MRFIVDVFTWLFNLLLVFWLLANVPIAEVEVEREALDHLVVRFTLANRVAPGPPRSQS